MSKSTVVAITAFTALAALGSLAHAGFTPIGQSGFVRATGIGGDFTETCTEVPWQAYVIADLMDGETGMTQLETSADETTMDVSVLALVTRGLASPSAPVTAFSEYASTLTFSLDSPALVRADFSVDLGAGTNEFDTSFMRLVRDADGQVLHSLGVAEFNLASGIYRIEIGGSLGNTTPSVPLENDTRNVFANLVIIPAPASACVGLLGCAALLRRRR